MDNQIKKQDQTNELINLQAVNLPGVQATKIGEEVELTTGWLIDDLSEYRVSQPIPAIEVGKKFELRLEEAVLYAYTNHEGELVEVKHSVCAVYQDDTRIAWASPLESSVVEGLMRIGKKITVTVTSINQYKEVITTAFIGIGEPFFLIGASFTMKI